MFKIEKNIPIPRMHSGMDEMNKTEEEHLQEFFLQWTEAKSKSTYWKEQESKFRDEMASIVLSGTIDTKTVICSDFYTKYQVKVTIGSNLKIDTEILEKIRPELSNEEKNCLGFTPRIKLKEYKKLEDKTQINLFITEIPKKVTITTKILE